MRQADHADLMHGRGGCMLSLPIVTNSVGRMPRLAAFFLVCTKARKKHSGEEHRARDSKHVNEINALAARHNGIAALLLRSTSLRGAIEGAFNESHNQNSTCGV